VEIAHLPLAYLPMPYLDEDSEEEVDSTIGLVDTWLTPPSTLPAGDNMHPPTETFSGAHPGEDWIYNKIGTPKYFWFLIPDLSIPRCQIVTP
jgi:hypothetical protein